jgi:RNA polymerase sigma factor for flagellar operon FliA
VQCGVFGLIDAVERFDPERNSRFESYAVPRIRGAILDELRAQDWVPRTVRGRTRELERAQERLEARLLRAPTDAELAAELGLAVHEVLGRLLGVTESRVCQLHTRLVGRLRGRLQELAAG